MKQLIKLMRPHGWLKNVFIFAPLFFAKYFFIYSKFSVVLLSFIVFCITASIVYILNDFFDIEQDKKHETKRNRPLASGKVTKRSALILFSFLILVVIFLICFFVPQISLYIFLYFILNIFYSKYLKHVAVLDILLISSFYFIRIMVGGIAAQVEISHWLLLCIIFVSLFLIVAKRIAEFGKEEKRAVLKEYTLAFLQSMLIISATLIIISYSLYGVLVLNTNLAMFSIFFVLLGIIRYLFIVFTTNKAEYPEKAVIKDKIILFSVILWIITMYLIIYR